MPPLAIGKHLYGKEKKEYIQRPYWESNTIYCDIQPFLRKVKTNSELQFSTAKLS